MTTRDDDARMTADILRSIFTDPGDLAEAVDAIRQDAAEADGPVISVHRGPVRQPEPDESALCRRCLAVYPATQTHRCGGSS